MHKICLQWNYQTGKSKKENAKFWELFYELIFDQPEADFHKEVFRNFTEFSSR